MWTLLQEYKERTRIQNNYFVGIKNITEATASNNLNASISGLKFLS